MQSKQLWYTRRRKEIRGPFPAGQITRDILLGRILQTDELSADQLSWLPVTALPELIPDELKADLTVFENKERLRIARYREDERQGKERRQQRTNNQIDGEQKRRNERRKGESFDALRYRELKSGYLDEVRATEKKQNVSPTFIIAFIVVVAVWVVTLFSPI